MVPSMGTVDRVVKPLCVISCKGGLGQTAGNCGEEARAAASRHRRGGMALQSGDRW
jgi:hypothetical protein